MAADIVKSRVLGLAVNQEKSCEGFVMADSERMRCKIRFGLIRLSDFQILGKSLLSHRKITLILNYSGNLSDFKQLVLLFYWFI